MLYSISAIAGATLSLLSLSPLQATNTQMISQTEVSTQEISGMYSSQFQTASIFGEHIPHIELDSELLGEKIEKEDSADEILNVEKKVVTVPHNSQNEAHFLKPEIILSLINQHRTDRGLTPLVEHQDLCTIAQSRVSELDEEIFGPTPMHQGMRDRNFSYWITENLIHQPTEEAAFNWWISSPVHRRAIESSTHIYTCGACQGNNCTQLFTSFITR